MTSDVDGTLAAIDNALSEPGVDAMRWTPAPPDPLAEFIRSAHQVSKVFVAFGYKVRVMSVHVAVGLARAHLDAAKQEPVGWRRHGAVKHARDQLRHARRRRDRVLF